MQNKIPINNLFHFPIYRNPLLQGFKATASVFSRYIANLLFYTKEELLTRTHNTENRDFFSGKLSFLPTYSLKLPHKFSVPHCGIQKPQCGIYISQCGIQIPKCETKKISVEKKEYASRNERITEGHKKRSMDLMTVHRPFIC